MYDGHELLEIFLFRLKIIRGMIKNSYICNM